MSHEKTRMSSSQIIWNGDSIHTYRKKKKITIFKTIELFVYEIELKYLKMSQLNNFFDLQEQFGC